MAISSVKWFFFISYFFILFLFVEENIFYSSLLNLNYWCFTILRKFQKKKKKINDQAEFVEILPQNYLPYRFLHSFFFYGEASENIWFKKTTTKNND